MNEILDSSCPPPPLPHERLHAAKDGSRDNDPPPVWVTQAVVGVKALQCSIERFGPIDDMVQWLVDRDKPGGTTAIPTPPCSSSTPGSVDFKPTTKDVFEIDYSRLHSVDLEDLDQVLGCWGA